MTTRIIFNDPLVTKIIANAIPASRSDADVSIALAKDDELVGGVIYKEFTGESLRMSAHAFRSNWGTRDFLWAVFDYPFNQLGVPRVYTHCRASRLDVIEFDHRLGFKDVAVLPGVYMGDVAAIVMKMERAECRWLNIKPHGYTSNVRRAA